MISCTPEPRNRISVLLPRKTPPPVKWRWINIQSFPSLWLFSKRAHCWKYNQRYKAKHRKQLKPEEHFISRMVGFHICDKYASPSQMFDTWITVYSKNTKNNVFISAFTKWSQTVLCCSRFIISSFLSNLTLITKIPKRFFCVRKWCFLIDWMFFCIQNCHINNYLSL